MIKEVNFKVLNIKEDSGYGYVLDHDQLAEYFNVPVEFIQTLATTPSPEVENIIRNYMKQYKHLRTSLFDIELLVRCFSNGVYIEHNDFPIDKFNPESRIDFKDKPYKGIIISNIHEDVNLTELVVIVNNEHDVDEYIEAILYSFKRNYLSVDIVKVGLSVLYNLKEFNTNKICLQ